MDEKYEIIELLQNKQLLEYKLSTLIYGAVEIREKDSKKYIYVHYRENGIALTKYVGEYSDDLYNLVLNNSIEAKQIKKDIRNILKRLEELNYTPEDLKEEIKINIDFAKRHLVDTIYKQAILEGIATTFADTESIIEGGKVNNMTSEDVMKIVNLKHAWEFILNKNVIQSPTNFLLLCEINKLVEEGFYYSAGKIRSTPVSIGGTEWKPEIPIESVVKEDLDDILPSFLEEGRQYTSTGTFSMPFSKSTEIVYYDKSKIIGLTLEGVNNGDPINQRYLDNLTWDEFFENFCPKLVAFTETDEGKNYIDKTGKDGWAVLSYDSDANLFITLAEQYGYDYTKVENGVGKLLFSNDGMKALCKKFNGYAKNHYINSQASTNVRSNTYMQAGQSLFAVGSTAGTQYYSPANNTIDIGVFRLPQKDNSNAKVLLQGPSMTFLRHLKTDGTTDQNRALASWLFYRHCITKQNALLWSTTANYMPIRESAYATKDYKEVYDEKECTPKTQDMLDARVANKVGDFQQMYFTSPAFKGSNAARDAVDGLMGKVLSKTCNGTDEEINAIFKEAYDAASKQL